MGVLRRRVPFLLTLLAPAFASGAAPVAEAGLGLVAMPGDQVELNGSGSSDPESDVLLYLWEQTGGPPVDFTGTDSAYPLVSIPEDGSVGGTLRFTLVVNDGTSESAPDSVEVVVPYQSIRSVETSCSATGRSPAATLAVGAVAALLCRRRRA